MTLATLVYPLFLDPVEVGTVSEHWGIAQNLHPKPTKQI